MKKLMIFIALITFYGSFSQEDEVAELKYDDPKYREDQFYIGVTYNFLNNKPTGISQNGLSGGYHFGFIRDLPINASRNVGFGIGLGYSHNSYNHNLYIKEENNNLIYQVLDNSVAGFDKNKLNLHAIEVPIQFRWRTSTAESHKFWRVYTGVKFGYVFSSIVKYKGSLGDYKQNNIKDLNKIQMDADIGFGWNTWNFYVSYGLNNLFSADAKLSGASIDISAIKFGLMFYAF